MADDLTIKIKKHQRKSGTANEKGLPMRKNK